MLKLKNLLTSFILIVKTLQQGTKTPKMIVELWRHGARSPAYNTFNQSYVVAEGPGNIVANGQRMHYLLGKQVRKDYPTIFPEGQKNISYAEYEVLSSSYQRTILSAYSHMMGIYPLGTGRIVSNDNPKTKIPPYKKLDVSLEGDFSLDQGANAIQIRVIDRSVDDFFMKGMKYVCKNADDKADDLFEKEVVTKNPLKEIGDKIKSAGYNCNDYFKNGKEYDLNTTGIFADVNKCYYYYNGKPMNGTEAFYDKMQYTFAIYYVNMRYRDPMVTKLWTTKMSQYIIDKMTAVTQGTSQLKYAGLSGHEANLFPYMILYKLTSEECLEKGLDNPSDDCLPGPEFAANIIWELAQDDQKAWFVKARYNGDKILTTCDKQPADGYCPFSDFVDFMNKTFILSPEDYKTTCGTPSQSQAEKESRIWMFIAIGIAILFTIQMIIFISYVGKAKNKNKQLNQELTGEADVHIDDYGKE